MSEPILESRGTYVFLTYSTKNVGGAQLYVSAKSKYLVEKGWNVVIVYSQDGQILISDLNNYHTIYAPFIGLKSYSFFRLIRKRLTRKILRNIPQDCCLIESHASNFSSWGEILAEETKSKHIVFNIDEKPQLPEPMFEYYKFKYYRGELAGIVEDSIKRFFSGTDVELTKGSPMIKAYGASDCIFDVDYEFNYPESDITIGVVGRLEKEYACNTAPIIADYVMRHPGKTYSIFYVGGQPKGMDIIEKIKDSYKNIPNIHLFFTGYIFPIPLKLVCHFDLCISGAGAANALKRAGVKTITVDSRDLKGIGVVGVTTTQTLFSDEGKEDLGYWFDEVLNHPEKYRLNRQANEYSFEEHTRFIESSEKELTYNLSFLEKRVFRIFPKKIVTLFYFIANSLFGKATRTSL